jgi:hypothetical protein
MASSVCRDSQARNKETYLLVGSNVVVKVDHGVDSLILHWVEVSEDDLEIDRLGELSGSLVGDNFFDLRLELVLFELANKQS